MPKIIKAWGGFSEGKLDRSTVFDQYDERGTDGHQEYMIFKTRRDAAKRYQDARRIEIHIPD